MDEENSGNESTNFSLVFTFEFEGCEMMLWTESEVTSELRQ